MCGCTDASGTKMGAPSGSAPASNPNTSPPTPTSSGPGFTTLIPDPTVVTLALVSAIPRAILTRHVPSGRYASRSYII